MLQSIDHPNLLKIFAVQVDDPVHIPRMTILLEQRSVASLRDVLQHSDGLKLERALVSAPIIEPRLHL